MLRLRYVRGVGACDACERGQAVACPLMHAIALGVALGALIIAEQRFEIGQRTLGRMRLTSARMRCESCSQRLRFARREAVAIALPACADDGPIARLRLRPNEAAHALCIRLAKRRKLFGADCLWHDCIPFTIAYFAFDMLIQSCMRRMHNRPNGLFACTKRTSALVHAFTISMRLHAAPISARAHALHAYALPCMHMHALVCISMQAAPLRAL